MRFAFHGSLYFLPRFTVDAGKHSKYRINDKDYVFIHFISMYYFYVFIHLLCIYDLKKKNSGVRAMKETLFELPQRLQGTIG